jgi:DNA invertase Pin-like site-specific DNA recombinase
MKPKSAAKREEIDPLVVAYIRVSSPSQDYAYQRSAIDTAARARGELVGRWYGDVASGSSMDRPALQRLRAELGSGAITRVWVWRLDRLSRSGIGDTLECVDEIRRSGATLASVADGFALDEGPAAELVLAVIAWAAQMERSKIRENQEAARARLAAQGRGWGRPALASHIRDAVVELEARRKTTREIARELQISKTSVGKYRRAKTREI